MALANKTILQKDLDPRYAPMMGARERTPLAENVRRLRELRGWSQEDLAARAELSSVSMVESGDRPNARSSTVAALAKALGVPVASLYLEHDATPNAELQRFLDSPAGVDVTAEERELLMWLDIPGFAHTQQSYAMFLADIKFARRL